MKELKGKFDMWGKAEVEIIGSYQYLNLMKKKLNYFLGLLWKLNGDMSYLQVRKTGNIQKT